MKRLNKENIFLLLTVVFCTLASMTQLASIGETITENRVVFIKSADLLTCIFGILYFFQKRDF